MPFTVPACWFRSKETILYTETVTYTIPLTVPAGFRRTETMPFTLPAGFTSEETMPFTLPAGFTSEETMPLLYLLVAVYFTCWFHK